MNKLTPYEILIAHKTEQVTVPDMADSIWTSIEAQLDAGPSPDDSNAGPSKPPVKGLPGSGNLLTLLSVAAIAIALTWFFTRNKKDSANKIEQPSISPATAISPPAADTNKMIDLAPKRNITVLPILAGKDTLLPTDNYTMPPIDTLNNVFIPPAIQPDSVFLSGDNKTPVIVDSSTILPPAGKKPKGVKGIGDNDYKIISSKKDSAKKRS